jgi:N-hydroxyarylamine O-acetyltransferase
VDHHTTMAYLSRIGMPERATEPSLELLRELHVRHLASVPFENLSIHLGEMISLAEADLVDKIVTRRRGGFCYELNGAFAALLRHLGYDVTMLAARVYGDAEAGPLFDHLTLRVDVDDAPWLVDVGFGRFVVAPFRLDVRAEQHDLAGVVRVVDMDEGDLQIRIGDRPQLLVEQRPRVLVDFAPTCWYQQTSPASHFTQSLTCSRPTGDHDRVTISDRLLITTVGGERTEATLGSDAEVLAAYREHFGFVLDRLPPPPTGTGPG